MWESVDDNPRFSGLGSLRVGSIWKPREESRSGRTSVGFISEWQGVYGARDALDPFRASAKAQPAESQQSNQSRAQQ